MWKAGDCNEASADGAAVIGRLAGGRDKAWVVAIGKVRLDMMTQ